MKPVQKQPPKKVGILTFHRAHNYGAVLQAYALKQCLLENGLQVFFINYQHPNIERAYRLFPRLSENSLRGYFRRCLDLMLDYGRKRKRFNGFESFINRNLSECDIHELEGFDGLVLGSDQIWNFKYTKGFVPEHFGIFHQLSPLHCFSYAASMGVSSLSEEQNSILAKYLEGLAAVGVREKSLASLIQNICPNQKVAINLDPTLLLHKKTWNGLAKSQRKAPYLLVYEVEQNEIINEMAAYVSQRLNLNVVKLCGRTNHQLSKNFITDASPEEFLGLFSETVFVLTTSFHGTVFSILNEKPFFTVGFGNDTDLRSMELLESLELKSQFVMDLNEIKERDLSVNFERVNAILAVLRLDSMAYLEKNLEPLRANE